VIREVSRQTDLLGRYYGEAFLLILPNTSEYGAKNMALRITRSIRESTIMLGASVEHITASTGISSYPGSGIQSADELLTAAEKSLVMAKAKGRDTVCCWDEVKEVVPQVGTMAREEIEAMHRKFYELTLELKATYIESTKALVKAIEAKDPFTKEHSRKVATIAAELARHIGIGEEQVGVIQNAAILHDVGKIGIPEEILLKPAELTTEEFSYMKKHPVIGANIVGQTRFLEEELPVIRHHHEDFDGKGYPSGLRGAAIPLAARIVRIADTFDAMTTDRAYRKKTSVDMALEEIRRCSGKEFDPDLVTHFSEIAHRVSQSLSDSTLSDVQ
jgi:putative nucleotidyltransferase with HDIG domain